MPHPATPTEPGLALVPAIPEVCPPGEGMFCVDRAAFADVAPLGETLTRALAVGTAGGLGEHGGDVDRRWPVLGDVSCTRFVPGDARDRDPTEVGFREFVTSLEVVLVMAGVPLAIMVVLGLLTLRPHFALPRRLRSRTRPCPAEVTPRTTP